MGIWGPCSGPVQWLEATTWGPPRQADGQAAKSSAKQAAPLAGAMPQGEALVPVAGPPGSRARSEWRSQPWRRFGNRCSRNGATAEWGR
jgi:hypothetical protein